jgi:hypothetical protein
MDGVYTQDWQEYECEVHKENIKERIMLAKRKDRQGCEEHGHVIFCKLNRCHEYFTGEVLDPLALANKLKKLPLDIRLLIRKFYNWMYYRSQVPNSVLSKIIYVHSRLWSTFIVTHQLRVPPLYYMRGYCPTCGEPVVSSKYFYWAWCQRHHLRTNSYTLSLMRVCATCRDCDFDFDNGQKIWKSAIISAPLEWIRYPYKLV